MPELDKAGRASAPLGGTQHRSYPAQFEVRGKSGDKVELRGYASTFEAPYEMFDFFGGYTETVRQGAFTKTLSDGADVAYLANHGGMTLARTKGSGTLRLSQDSTGLDTVATLNTTRSDARDLVTAIEDGDIDEMSFGFRMIRQEWSPDYEQRDLVELDLNKGDVSAVNYGANPATSVDVQRAFRHQRAAGWHRLAVELREGRPLAPASVDLLSRMLELVAAVEDDRGEEGDATRSQPSTASPGAVDDAARRDLAQLELLRRQHAREAESLRA